MEVLVDGAAALPAMVEAMLGAESHVWLAGWYFSPEFRMGPHGPALAEFLADLARRVDVRVLMWAGSPLPLFHPDRSQGRQVCERMTRGTQVRFALDSLERPLHCHHEKLVIVDGRVGFVGGIDLTAYSGDRYDDSGHEARPGVGWHDAAVRVEGPAVTDVADHYRLRWHEVTGETLPQPAPAATAGDVELQVVRTVPEHVYDALPRGDFRILESYVRALRSAQRLIYLENQFLWSPEIVAILAEKLRRPPRDDFRLLAVLPTKANSGQDDTRGQLGVLAEADGGAGRFLACCVYQRGGDRPVYVHAKIGIVDDRWLTLGSANLNEHSLFNDTEMNIVSHDPALARSTRLRLWTEHLERDDVDGDPAQVIDSLWRPLAEEQLARLEAESPLTHRLVRLPHVSRRARRLLGPLEGLLVDG